jgi:polyferredoxin
MNKPDRKRFFLQIFFLIISLVLLTLLIWGILGVSHTYCPFAGVCFGIFSLNPAVSVWLFKTAAIVGLLIALSTIFWGRKFCGYVCFLGTLQEFIYKLNRGKKKHCRKFPFKLHLGLRILKYLVLAFTAVTAFLAVQYLYMQFCPVYALAHPQNISLAAIFTLLVIFGLGIWVERFGCRYLCPYAALMNLFQYLGKLLGIKRQKIQRNIEISVNCKTCLNYCSMSIEIGCKKEIENINCIYCGRCIRTCEKDNFSPGLCLYRD